jgi:hypothetical protein
MQTGQVLALFARRRVMAYKEMNLAEKFAAQSVVANN